MIKLIFSIILFSVLGFSVHAQETREDLEKQRAQLKKEMEQTQRLLNSNKSKTKQNLVQWKLINDKLNLQNRLIDNISKDINILDNNIYTNQREITRYNKLLDTLKEEYAKQEEQKHYTNSQIQSPWQRFGNNNIIEGKTYENDQENEKKFSNSKGFSSPINYKNNFKNDFSSYVENYNKSSVKK